MSSKQEVQRSCVHQEDESVNVKRETTVLFSDLESEDLIELNRLVLVLFFGYFLCCPLGFLEYRSVQRVSGPQIFR